MHCSNCGHDNPEENRYCGMCGSPLEKPSGPAEETSPGDETRSTTEREHSITGPSFLGIGDEPQPAGNRYSYLLDYEEPRSHRGLWVTLVLLVAATLLALQFRTELRARAGRVYAAALARLNPPLQNAKSGRSGDPGQLPAPPAAPASALNPSPPEPPAAAQGENGSQGASAVTGESQPADSQNRPNPDEGASSVPSAIEKQPAVESEKSASDTEDNSPVEKIHRARKPSHAGRTRPVPEQAASLRDDHLLQLAQKYIHGQGVRRDCERGLIYLRQAMQTPSAPAATQMGALYATGTCVPLNRVAAYRYFTSALQMSPSNPWLARERDRLYAQMSSSERRQADRQ